MTTSTLNQIALPSFTKGRRTVTPTERPTKNKGIIDRWMVDGRRRFRELLRVINETVMVNDAFGLRVDNVEAAGRGAFSRGQEQTRIDNFLRWLVRQEREGILEIITPPGARQGRPWSDVYVRQNFTRGAVVGNAQVLGLGVEVPRLGTNPDAVVNFLSQPHNVERLKIIQTRTWTGMRGITETMNAQIANEIAQGFALGESPRQMAYRINDRVRKIGMSRADLIARTEANAAYNEGAIAEYDQAGGIVGENIHTQWHATLDSRVRDSHLRRHGKIFKKEDALKLIGEPNCRCSLLPYVPSVEGKAKFSKASTFMGNVIHSDYWRAENAREYCCG